MGSVVRRAHGNQCREKETRTIRRNEGNWPRSSANCLLLGDASGFARGDVFARIRKELNLLRRKSAPRGKMK